MSGIDQLRTLDTLAEFARCHLSMAQALCEFIGRIKELRVPRSRGWTADAVLCVNQL
jgi:hypothetical protein